MWPWMRLVEERNAEALFERYHDNEITPDTDFRTGQRNEYPAQHFDYFHDF